MEIIAATAINGILLGGLYACVGMGFALTWGILNVVNLAHGVMVILGAYVTFVLYKGLGVDPLLTIPVSMALLFAFGYGLQRGVINLIVRAPVFMTLILTFGLEMLIINALLFGASADFRAAPPSYAAAVIRIGPFIVPVLRLTIFAVALLLTALLFLFMYRTRRGNAILATGQDKEAAELVGVDIAKTYAMSFGIASAFAGAAGSLIASLYAFSPVLGGPYTLKAFLVTVVGGLGSMAGPIVGGLVLGLAETGGSLAFGETWVEVVSYGLLVLILIVRPEGILGKKYFAEVRN
jgi:branched-chain amino acid transport system permease protein